MPLPKTPGQAAYDKWRELRDHLKETEPWIRLHAYDKSMWEEVANAAIASNSPE